MKSLTLTAEAAIKEDVVMPEPTVAPEVISDYKKLNEKCDAVISKIKGRKKNKKSAGVK